ncbi:MAG: alpha/beta hydrolase [Actinomycetota bacterium]|nr:alpha/beta hydrolase [Actinomycetota bacterium]
MPTRVVWGTSGRVFSILHARAAAARLQKGFLNLIPDCGHLLHVEYPDRFVATLDRFLSEQTYH